MSGQFCSILWSVWIGKSYSNVRFSDSSTGFGSCSYQFWKQSKPKFWQNLQWTHLPILSCLQPLFSFWADFVHFVTMWLMVSSRSPHIPIGYWLRVKTEHYGFFRPRFSFRAAVTVRTRGGWTAVAWLFLTNEKKTTAPKSRQLRRHSHSHF